MYTDIGTEEKNHLHNCVEDGDDIDKQVQVLGGEDDYRKYLAFPSDVFLELGLPGLPQEHGQEVAQSVKDTEHNPGPASRSNAHAQPVVGKLSGGQGGCHTLACLWVLCDPVCNSELRTLCSQLAQIFLICYNYKSEIRLIIKCKG